MEKLVIFKRIATAEGGTILREAKTPEVVVSAVTGETENLADLTNRVPATTGIKEAIARKMMKLSCVPKFRLNKKPGLSEARQHSCLREPN